MKNLQFSTYLKKSKEKHVQLSVLYQQWFSRQLLNANLPLKAPSSVMLFMIIIDGTECNTVTSRKSSRAARLLMDAAKVFPHLASKCEKFLS